MLLSFIKRIAYNYGMLNVAKINLNKLTKNALKIKGKLDDNTKFCAVVKADAYGHGAPVIANALYKIVDYYAVALVEEGVELRNSGIDKDILVLTPIFNRDVELAVFFGLTLTVENKKQIELIDRESKRQNKKTKIHLKYNVGMNRFGVDTLEELKALIEFSISKNCIILDGMYSHLACPQNKKLLKIAENKFLLANNLVKGYNNNAICHLSASGGFLMGKHFDMVRVGVLLYGYKPFKSNYIDVEPIMKVYAPIVKRRRLKKGQSALYGNYKLKRDKDVSLIRFGYADGLERRCVHGQINNRCMDLTTLEQGKSNSRFVILDDADVLAKKYQTIPYEILSKISIRARKIYIR